MKRSKEEVELLESEIESTEHYYTMKIQAIDNTLSILSERDDKINMPREQWLFC